MAIGSEHFDSKDEVPFSFEELFFSRTDTRGIIMSGNSVFQRISLYSWDELIKKPHNLIRHPDMPKGVFYLFWDFLKQGKPIGAYVKNRAKDGRYYWVFAVATPIDGGYLSVRLKPSSDFLPLVEEKYKALVANEQLNKVTPQESMNVLLGELAKLGFDSYEEFMSTALCKEIVARSQKLNHENRLMASFSNISTAAKSLLKQTASIFASYEINKYVPLNLQIQSAQLGAQGATIGVISSNYNVVSTEIKNEIDRFSNSAQEMLNKINMGQFLLGTASMQQEVIKFFKTETALSDEEKKREMTYLQAQQETYQQKADEGLKLIMDRINHFQEDCHKMKLLASSLEVIRIMGKVDASRLTVSNGALTELIDDLRIFQSSISTSLKEIDQVNRQVKYEAQGIIKSLHGEASNAA